MCCETLDLSGRAGLASAYVTLFPDNTGWRDRDVDKSAGIRSCMPRTHSFSYIREEAALVDSDQDAEPVACSGQDRYVPGNVAVDARVGAFGG